MNLFIKTWLRLVFGAKTSISGEMIQVEVKVKAILIIVMLPISNSNLNTKSIGSLDSVQRMQKEPFLFHLNDIKATPITIKPH